MPSEIDSIKGGVVGKPYIDTSKFNSFMYFFYMNDDALEQIENIDTSNATMFGAMFGGCTSLTTIPQLDVSNGTMFNSMFVGCTSLTTIPQLDVSNGTDFSSMFSGCTSLTTIPQLDVSNGTMFNSMFSNCTNLIDLNLITLSFSLRSNDLNVFYGTKKLTNVTFTGTIKILNNNFKMNDSNILTVESMVNIMNAFEDNSNLSTIYTVYFGATNLAKLTEEQKNIAYNKNIALG